MGLLDKRGQVGASLVSWLVVLVLFASATVVGLQTVPTVLEYVAVKKAVRKAALSATPEQALGSFASSASLDSIQSVKAEDLQIDLLQDGRLLVRFAYQREIHLLGPAYLTLKYAGHS